MHTGARQGCVQQFQEWDAMQLGGQLQVSPLYGAKERGMRGGAVGDDGRSSTRQQTGNPERK
jgi:hypothetical protein